MFKACTTIIVLAGLLVLGGCASTPDTDVLPSGDDAPNPLEAALLDDYRIGIGDVLNVSIWRNADISTQASVLPDGTISVPLVGDVAAAGQTTESLAAQISEVLQSYIREPVVTVSVVSAASAEFLQRVRITGAVASPISIVHRRGLTVLDLVLQAGGLTQYANANKALLYRQTDEGLKVYPVRLRDILERGRLETNYTMLPSDIITVPEKSF